MAEGLKVLRTAVGSDVVIETTEYDLGARRWHATGETLPDSVLTEIRQHDVILLGAVGDPGVPSGVLERGLLLRLRFELDHYVNLRPARLYPGVISPLAPHVLGDRELDFVVVREGTEGPYVGNGGAVRTGTPHEIATEVSINTAYGVERVVRDAFRRAAARPRRKLTLLHKHNVLTHAGHLWRRTVEQVNADFPEVTSDYLHVDAATIFLVQDPTRFDVIVTDNLFEPVHGSAPDIAGQQKADPTATVLSVAMLLEHIGLDKAAQRVEQAVAADLAIRDIRVPRSTAQIGEAIASRLAD